MSDTWVKDRLETQVGKQKADQIIQAIKNNDVDKICLLYTSPSPRDTR